MNSSLSLHLSDKFPKRSIGSVIGMFGLIISITLYLAGIAMSEPATFYGTGYPPLKAQNKSQAILMARRAALLDAYRNALREFSETGQDEMTPDYFEHVAGFLRKVEIVNETYLADGGVRVTAIVHGKDIQIPAHSQKPINTHAKKMNAVPGPAAVSLEEWVRIIEQQVQFMSESP